MIDVTLKVGLPLISLNGSRIGNAVVIAIDNEKDRISVLTDFGNIISNLNIHEFAGHFTIPDWAIDTIKNGEEFPSIRDRVDKQLELLIDFKTEYFVDDTVH